MNKIYIIWIGWIGTSWLARYYNSIGYDVYGSDGTESELIENLRKEGINVNIWIHTESITKDFECVIHSEAIPETHEERLKAKELGIKNISYPTALWEITKELSLISIAGTHGKSTTTSLTSLVLKSSELPFSSIVWTILTEFWGKNFYHQDENSGDESFFVLESCEYKEAFLHYHPYIAVITNVEADHLDYYHTLENYVNAFKKFIGNIKKGGYAIINMEDTESKTLLNSRNDINFIEVYKDHYVYKWEKYIFPEIHMQVPWDHILFDAKLAYITGMILWIEEEKILSSLEKYVWVWRRMEIIGKTENWNTLMSDYGHHPTEIKLTTKAIKDKFSNKKLYCVFQPHQYSRTIELLEDFKTCFDACNTLVIPDIYESRDSEENKKKINALSFSKMIHHPNVIHGEGLKNTKKIIEEYDIKNQNGSIILLLWAGNVDNLRYEIPTKK